MKTRSSLPTLRTISYVLSVCLFLLGLIAGISLLASSGSVQNVLMPLQVLGGGAIVNLITPYLTGFLSGLGMVTLIVSLVLSLLLFALGSLLGFNVSLDARLSRLESALSSAS